MTFNPVTSSKAKLFMQDEKSRIFTHKAKGVAGKFIVSDDWGDNWTACETLESALKTVPGEPEWKEST